MELFAMAYGVVWIFLIVAAVLLFMLPFFVFKIRNEIVEMNIINKRILVLLEAVIPENKKPPKPKKVVCATCRTENEETRIHCRHCRSRLTK